MRSSWGFWRRWSHRRYPIASCAGWSRIKERFDLIVDILEDRSAVVAELRKIKGFYDRDDIQRILCCRTRTLSVSLGVFSLDQAKIRVEELLLPERVLGILLDQRLR